MQTRHPVRDSIESVEKYVETLSLKAQANIPGAQSVISTAKKVGSPVLKSARRLGEPVVNAIDSGINSMANNSTAIYNTTSDIAKNGVEAAFHVTDRVLTPPPDDENKQPYTLRGLITHINKSLRYQSATKLKPMCNGVDPYEKVSAIVMIMSYIFVLMWHVLITPWQMLRNRVEPMILWGIGHKCNHDHDDNTPNGVRRRGGDLMYEHPGAGNDEDASSNSVNERNTSGSRCSTGAGSGGTTRGNKTGHHHQQQGKRPSSRPGNNAKTNASNSHDET